MTTRSPPSRSTASLSPGVRHRRKRQKVETVDDVIIVSHALRGCLDPIIRVATGISNPRVAFLCRVYALRLSESVIGRGVMQFRTAIQQQIDRDDASTLASRVKASDREELGSFYLEHYNNKVLNGEEDQFGLALDTAEVLFQVLCLVSEGVELIPSEIIAASEDVQAKRKRYAPYNILPLDSSGESQAIMQLKEVRAALDAVRNTSGLNWPHQCDQYRCSSGSLDTFDWLRVVFGFQRDNVRNQRENLILLLANSQVKLIPNPRVAQKLDDRAVDALGSKLFDNYQKWCRYMNIENHTSLPQEIQEKQQRKILYMALYFLIWGEAGNVRFMPECLCYIFHNMVSELHRLLDGNVNNITGEDMRREDEYFLKKIITPFYRVIEQEANKSINGKAPHPHWCNYDDINEFFWTSACFCLDWPMHDDTDFFESINTMIQGKLNFSETRSSCHIFRSYDRLWAFFLLVLQALIIIAWSENSFLDIFHENVFRRLSSMLLLASLLRFLHSVMDLYLDYFLYHRWSHVMRTIVKIVVNLAWLLFIIVVINDDDSPLYLWAWAVFLLSTTAAVILFNIPLSISRSIENSDCLIVRPLQLCWPQPQVYVGSGMRENCFASLKYTLFWIVLLGCKFVYTYHFQLKPLVGPSKDILKLKNVDSESHEPFKNRLAVFSLWSPVLLIYLMDTQICYAIFATIVGGLMGVFDCLGEIRSLGMLRSRFQSLPGAFSRYLVPPDPNKNTGCSASKQFVAIWNEVIRCFREEDLISDRKAFQFFFPSDNLSCNLY